MNSYVVLLVVVNALSCLAGKANQVQLKPGCNDLQQGLLAGTPLVLSYSIPPQTTNGIINIYRDFYSQCPYGPNSVLGVYVMSCEISPNCMAPTLAVVFERSPSDAIEIYRSKEALMGYNSVQVTVYCSSQASP